MNNLKIYVYYDGKEKSDSWEATCRHYIGEGVYTAWATGGSEAEAIDRLGENLVRLKESIERDNVQKMSREYVDSFGNPIGRQV